MLLTVIAICVVVLGLLIFAWIKGRGEIGTSSWSSTALQRRNSTRCWLRNGSYFFLTFASRSTCWPILS